MCAHPFIGPGDQTGRPYILRNVLFMECGGCVNLSKCQTNRPRRGFLASNYAFVSKEGLSRAICVLHVVGISVGFLFFCFLFLFLCSFPSVFSHGWTQFHTFGIVPLWSLKNGDRGLFSYGRVGTTVRTRRYDGSRSSVRSQSPVLLTATMGATDGLFALETV